MGSIKYKLIELNDIGEMFGEIQNEKLKNTLIYKLSEELDDVINKYENLYYKAYNNPKYRKNLIRNTKNDRHNNIIHTHSTMNTFMPYILLHNLASAS